jgi:hypothetical protein
MPLSITHVLTALGPPISARTSLEPQTIACATGRPIGINTESQSQSATPLRHNLGVMLDPSLSQPSGAPGRRPGIQEGGLRELSHLKVKEVPHAHGRCDFIRSP